MISEEGKESAGEGKVKDENDGYTSSLIFCFAVFTWID
jgi:hypothetical protein